jgi:hypothetical protein
VLDLDLGIRLTEELDDARVALARERVDRDLTLLPGGGHDLLPLGGGARATRPTGDGGRGESGGAAQQAATGQRARVLVSCGDRSIHH